MKKLFLALSITAITATSFAQGGLQIGLSLGTSATLNQFADGMSNASALFSDNPYLMPEIGITVQKCLNEHFSLQAGLSASSIGFSYAIAQDYSLLEPWNQYAFNTVTINCAKLPVDLAWKSRLDCKNVREVIGAGFTLLGYGKTNATNNMSLNNESLGNNNLSSYFNQSVQAPGGLALTGHIVFGIERVYSNDRILGVYFWFDPGFGNVATSNVTYTAENQVYNHTFATNGTSFGWTAAYYFKPLKPKAHTASNSKS
jgi:hypothetical protein